MVNVTLIFQWHTTADERACIICRPIDGHLWRIPFTGTDAFPKTLEFQGKTVWDLTLMQPRTHGAQSYNCRCWVTWILDWSELILKLQLLRSALAGI
jgi:hypothetical protein